MEIMKSIDWVMTDEFRQKLGTSDIEVEFVSSLVDTQMEMSWWRVIAVAQPSSLDDGGDEEVRRVLVWGTATEIGKWLAGASWLYRRHCLRRFVQPDPSARPEPSQISDKIPEG